MSSKKEPAGPVGDHLSVWQETAPPPAYPALKSDVSCDVCVVGAGIAGITTAFRLLQEGLSVVVLDAGPVGGGETGRTSAHLCSALDDRFYRLEKTHGKDAARLAAESHAAAVDWIEKTAAGEDISCAFERVDGHLFSASDGDSSELEEEFEAARRAGLDVSWEVRAPWASYNTGRCLRFARQAQFHPLRYLNGLAAAVTRLGGRIFTETRVSSAAGGAPARVETRGGAKVTAKHVVLATNVPVNDRVVVHTKQAAYRSFVIGAPIPAEAAPRGLAWDTGDPYHYVRAAAGVLEDPKAALLIVGGEDARTGQEDGTEDPFGRLEAWARARFPEMGRVSHRWSGQILETIDGLGFIGRNPMDKPNVYISTGDSGNGLTHGTIAGLLISDLILGRPNPWEKVYDPARARAAGAGEFLRENLSALPYYLEWLTPGGVKKVRDIAPGGGEVIREGLKKVAVYKDPEGRLCALSAVCPHLGALVRWNPVEKSWDCPLHGSRFDPAGRVLNGPANADLEPLDREKSLPS